MLRNTHSVLCGLAFVSAGLLAVPRVATAHDERPPWLEESALEDGLHIAVQHARVIRAPGPITMKITLRNMAGEHDVTIDTIRYVLPLEDAAELHRFDRTLPTRRAAFELYKATVAQMHESAHREDAGAVERISQQARNLLHELTAGALTDRYRVPAERIPTEVGSSFRMTVEIAVVENGSRRVIRRPVEIPVQSPLPDGTTQAQRWSYDVHTRTLERREESAAPPERVATAVWYAGDQHLHTTYSLDAIILHGTVADVTDYATAAESIGLDWIIVTDHSNVHYNHQGTEYFTPEQFDAGTAQAAAYTAGNTLLALYGEEMGAGRAGLLALPSHYLAYPFATASTGYLANPSSGLIYGLANCEDEQVIIDRVNDAGGFGFIAHPFDSGALAFAEWNFNNGATGWGGLEIWSDTLGQIKTTDDQALAKWHDLLNTIPAPQQGALSERPGFPNAFPVGLGNSDAHELGLIGATFTYAWMPAFSRTAVVTALMEGRCVASNGPLLFGEINGGRVGEVAFLLDGDNDLDLTLTTTAEFGPVGDYTLTVYVNGTVRTTVPPTGDPGFSTTIQLAGLNLGAPDKFVTLRADSSDGVYHAITNPIWLEFTDVPANDDCASALLVTDGTPAAEGNNSQASGTDDDAASCHISQSDVWFEYVATCTGQATVDTFGSRQSDTVLSVYDTCGGNEIACNDDFGGPLSQVTFAVAIGQSYWIRLASSGVPGDYDLNVDISCGSPTCPHPCGDIDGSGGGADLSDFATFAACYGYTAPNPPDCEEQALACSDLDGSGTVDLADFATFAAWYGLPTTQTAPNCQQP